MEHVLHTCYTSINGSINYLQHNKNHTSAIIGFNISVLRTNATLFNQKTTLKKHMTDKKQATKKLIEPEIFQGAIVPMQDNAEFYMVVVEGSIYPPTVKHETFDEAFHESLRLSKKENRIAYVLKSITKVQQIPYVTKLKPITK